MAWAISLIFAQATSVDLLKIIPDGLNVFGVIVVVILFLKQQREFNNIITSLTDEFHAQIKENQRAFQEQIGQLTGEYFTNQKMFQEQIQRLMEAHMIVTRETITILQSLKGSVDMFTQKIDRIEAEWAKMKALSVEKG